MKRKLITLFALGAMALGVNTKAATTDDLPGVDVQPASYFYTGKPYDADLDAYVFAYRNYDPELKRWTTIDPSGFPDGANGYSYVTGIPTHAVDPTGCALQLVSFAFTWTDPVQDEIITAPLITTHSIHLFMSIEWTGGGSPPSADLSWEILRNGSTVWEEGIAFVWQGNSGSASDTVQWGQLYLQADIGQHELMAVMSVGSTISEFESITYNVE